MYGECEASGTAGTPEAGLAVSSLLLCSHQLRLPAHWPRSVLALIGVATRDKISIDQIETTCGYRDPDKGQGAAVPVEPVLRVIELERDPLAVED